MPARGPQTVSCATEGSKPFACFVCFVLLALLAVLAFACFAGRGLARDVDPTRPATHNKTTTHHKHILYDVCCCFCCLAGRGRARDPNPTLALLHFALLCFALLALLCLLCLLFLLCSLCLLCFACFACITYFTCFACDVSILLNVVIFWLQPLHVYVR